LERLSIQGFDLSSATFAAVAVSVETSEYAKASAAAREGRRGGSGWGLAALTLLALLVHGYHPYAEDGGIYAAGIKLRLNPALYGASAEFIRPYMRMSVFSNWNAGLVSGLHLPLEVVLLLMQVGTTAWLLYGCLGLARRCFSRVEAQWGAVLLVTLCLTVPAAGTSLFLMDPYLTSRSISTPCTLMAMGACLDRRMGLGLMWLAVAAIFHPLMGIYGAGFVLLLWAMERRSRVGVAAVAVGAFVLGGVVTFSQRGVVETANYKAAVLTRYYYFVSMWHWYEWVGLAAPLVLAGIYCRWRAWDMRRADVLLAATAGTLGAIAVGVCVVFTGPGSRSHLVSALQPLRSFLLIYYCMFLLLGGTLAEVWLRRGTWRWAALVLAVGGTMFGFSRATYSESAHVEMPGAAAKNDWVKAFLWIKANTPVDTVVALDADYIQAAGEDGQGFRAIAERSGLADYSKDGGAAAAFPQIADAWMREQAAVTGLSKASDAERRVRVEGFGVGWVVLKRGARTGMDCPYGNGLVKVCRMR
jgi:hypothetical protein